MKYIAYGSNMNHEQMARRCPGSKLIGTGYLTSARLEFYLHATVEKTEDPRDRVPVAVWEISEENEQILDIYEGYPAYYVKETWKVHMDDGTETEGMIYLMKLIRQDPPQDAYYKGIAEAYRTLGMEDQISKVLEPARKRSIERELQ